MAFALISLTGIHGFNYPPRLIKNSFFLEITNYLHAPEEIIIIHKLAKFKYFPNISEKLNKVNGGLATLLARQIPGIIYTKFRAFLSRKY